MNPRTYTDYTSCTYTSSSQQAQPLILATRSSSPRRTTQQESACSLQKSSLTRSLTLTLHTMQILIQQSRHNRSRNKNGRLSTLRNLTAHGSHSGQDQNPYTTCGLPTLKDKHTPSRQIMANTRASQELVQIACRKQANHSR